MVPMHGRKAEGAFHERWLVWSSAFRRLEPLEPAEAGTPNKLRPTARFMVPMHGRSKAEGVFHERWLVWSSAFRRLEPLEPAEAGTPNKLRPTARFMVPMHG